LYTETEHSKPLLIPIPTACNMLGGITRPTVYNLINAGELHRVKIGKRAFITSASIDAYVERQMQVAAAQLEADRDAAS
jgi:excisionase family DNA binding protein